MDEYRIIRFKELIDHFNLTPNAFAKKIKVDSSNFKKMLDGEQKITDKTITKIVEAYPQISIEWLRSGEGEMISNNISLNPTIANVDNDSNDLVPLLPVEAIAGSLQWLSDGVELSSCRKIKSPVKGADWAIQISGDSMEPDFRNGSYLYIKKMSGGMMPWGHTMVVDTYDGVVVKKIFPVENNKDVIEVRSINPKYPPFQIEKSIILGIYRVLGSTFINSTI